MSEHTNPSRHSHDGTPSGIERTQIVPSVSTNVYLRARVVKCSSFPCWTLLAPSTSLGDPHMTGFQGQKFDFTGEDGEWYCLISDLPSMHMNMRVTTPLPSTPEITYITGLSVATTDNDGVDHSIIIEVTNPHSMESACPDSLNPCLADGALSVFIDGSETMLQPGNIEIAQEDVKLSAANLPGECRSFGFENYWEQKTLAYAHASGRNLSAAKQGMGEWIIDDPTATNPEECMEYVANAMSRGEAGLFEHQSEHASFQIATPTATIRLNHGRLHQLPMRDPTDRFDLPEHLTWQMNIAVDHNDISMDAKGILGETLVPTIDEDGNRIMSGMASIRGSQADCEWTVAAEKVLRSEGYSTLDEIFIAVCLVPLWTTRQSLHPQPRAF